MAMDFLLQYFSKLDPLIVNKKACTRLLSPRSTCNRCVENCDNQWISISDQDLQIQQCNYCGKCVFACPNHVFKLDEDALIEHAKNNLGSVILLSCTSFKPSVKESYPQEALQIHCYNQLYPELVLFLLSCSEELLFIMEPDHCKSCHKFMFAQLFEEVAAYPLFSRGQLMRKLRWISEEEANLLSPQKKARESKPERRDFFRSVFASTKKIPKAFLKQTLDTLDLEDHSFHNKTVIAASKKVLLIDALLHNLPKEDQPLPFQTLQVTECNFCGVCEKFCPTGALTILDATGEKKLLLDNKKCTACNLCIDLCYTGKIAWQEKTSTNSFLSNESTLLAVGHPTCCAICEEDFWQILPSQTMPSRCPLCKDKE